MLPFLGNVRTLFGHPTARLNWLYLHFKSVFNLLTYPRGRRATSTSPVLHASVHHPRAVNDAQMPRGVAVASPRLRCRGNDPIKKRLLSFELRLPIAVETFDQRMSFWGWLIRHAMASVRTQEGGRLRALQTVCIYLRSAKTNHVSFHHQHQF